MEGVALALIGAAIFSHSWYLLGLYSDGRTVGIVMAAIALGLVVSLTFEPQILGTGGTNPVQRAGEIITMKGLIVAWAIYAAAMAAQGLWDLEERAIGFYSAALTAVSAVSIFYFATVLFAVYGTTVMVSLAITAAVLSLLGGLMFFYMAIPFNALKLVCGWAMLIGSIVVAGVGLAIITTVIAP